MPNSIQFNEQMFMLIALTCLVCGIILTCRRGIIRRRWLRRRRIHANVSAEEQAEQIVRMAWADSEEEEWKL